MLNKDNPARFCPFDRLTPARTQRAARHRAFRIKSWSHRLLAPTPVDPPDPRYLLVSNKLSVREKEILAALRNVSFMPPGNSINATVSNALSNYNFRWRASCTARTTINCWFQKSEFFPSTERRAIRLRIAGPLPSFTSLYRAVPAGSEKIMARLAAGPTRRLSEWAK